MPNYSNEILAANIKRIIEEKGIKHCFIAKRLGLSDSGLCRLLNGQRVIRASFIPTIADALGITPNDLFDAPKEAG